MFYDMSYVISPSNSETDVTNSEDIIEGPTPDPVTTPPQSVYILLTTVSGKALSQYRVATDSQIVEQCVQTLRLMFGTDTVSPVLGYLVSRWGSDPHVGMSYSYVAVGASGDDYDIMAETVHDKIHFAGEVGHCVGIYIATVALWWPPFFMFHYAEILALLCCQCCAV